ncbi:MAG: aminomethyl-transferring glycine dehydrogenase subunit GcvPA [Candidatus Methanomethylicia archaeon]|nr:aminomethyl-transferring glycine dehydrogenase subunit GcvPA [Candidatus Methanomethylicia archaeon]NHV45272.1 aminomethyl-transferring glycine dehydrogenase subunit GcvPA [Candidatus Verstraetearchaeota archaeon]
MDFFNHPYIPNASILNEMLKEVGIEKIDDLFNDVIKIDFDLNIPILDEYSIYKEVKSILSKNKIYKCFMGGGPWFHFVPSITKYLITRGEFLTSYTPYQPEISQGVLQALFEFQSMICELYNMEVANASLYDFPTAIGEAILLSSRVTGRKKVIIPSSIPEDRKSVIRNYAINLEIIEVPFLDNGCPDLEYIKKIINKDIAGVYTEIPNFFGVIDFNLKELIEISHEVGAIAIIGADPLLMGIIKPPGDYGADIVVGDGQPLGIPPAMGGNSLGIIACKNDMRIIRQMPGRIVGMTRTIRGERAFTLVLSTREQHIRREKATSNICTNETLLAIAATIYMALLGKEGIKRIAKRIFHNTQYTIKRIKEIGLDTAFKGLHFRDFTIKGINIKKLNRFLKDRGILGGREISENIGLFAVTEIHKKEDIDEFIDLLKEFIRRN